MHNCLLNLRDIPTLPVFASVTALATSAATVPLFGLGIKPRGPSNRAYLPSFAIYCGVAISTSSLILLYQVFLRNSSSPIILAPASLAAECSLSGANTATRISLPVPCGRLTVARIF